MSARQENRDRQGPETSPFFTYRRGAVVPDNSKTRTPIGSMSHAEIYGPAMDKMPACAGDCGQRGGAHCKTPGQCQADSRALRRLAVFCAAAWGVVGVLGYLLVQVL